jgi:cell division septal protein FtsQ
MRRKIKIKSHSSPKGGKIIKALFYLLLLSFFGAVIYSLFFSGYLAVANIAITGQENIETSSIEKEIKSRLDGQFFHLVSKNNLLLMKTSGLERDIAEKFKKINRVEIKRKFPSGLIVDITEKKLRMIFCSREKCFILDETGNAFEEIGENSQEYAASNLPVLKDSSNPEVSPGGRMVDPSYIDFSDSVKNKLERELDIFLEREYSTPNRISGDLKVTTKDGWGIYFDAGLDAGKEVEILKTVLDEKIPQGERVNLEYIDLRSDNKVFYKFKEGTQEEVKTEEEKKTEEQPKTEEKKSDKKKKK